MKEYQIRVVDEKNELDEKLKKLEAFLSTPLFNDIDSYEEKIRLKQQFVVMQEYSKILAARIADF